MQPRRLFSPLEISVASRRCNGTNTFKERSASTKTSKRFKKCNQRVFGELFKSKASVKLGRSRTWLLFEQIGNFSTTSLPFSGIATFSGLLWGHYGVSRPFQRVGAYFVYNAKNELDYVFFDQPLEYYEGFAGKQPISKESLVSAKQVKANIRRYAKDNRLCEIDSIDVWTPTASLDGSSEKVQYSINSIIQCGNESKSSSILRVDARSGEIKR
jgi:hypothetical protein